MAPIPTLKSPDLGRSHQLFQSHAFVGSRLCNWKCVYFQIECALPFPGSFAQMLLTNNQRHQQISSGQPAKSAIAKDPVKFSTRHWFLTCSCCQETVLSSCVLSTFCCKLEIWRSHFVMLWSRLLRLEQHLGLQSEIAQLPERPMENKKHEKHWKTRVPSSPIPITWSPVSRCLPNLDRLCDQVCWASSGTTLPLWWLAKTVANLQVFAGPRRSAHLSFSLLSSCRVTPFWKFH